jgi:hypothetical protein
MRKQSFALDFDTSCMPTGLERARHLLKDIVAVSRHLLSKVHFGSDLLRATFVNGRGVGP